MEYLKRYNELLNEGNDGEDISGEDMSVVNNNIDTIMHVAERSWGTQYQFMEKHGHAIATGYIMNENKKAFGLKGLSVSPEHRKKGYGLALQEMREELGNKLGCEYCALWVKKNTWMHDWYKRRGYVDGSDYPGDKNAIWMTKKL